MKILVALLGLFVVTGAFAEDTVDVEEDVTVEESVSVEETGNVVERVACDDIKTKIADLTALEEPTEDEIAELEKLKQEQRTKCMRSASKRKASVAKKVVVEASAAIEEEAEEVEEEVVEEVVEETVVEETANTTETAEAPKMMKNPRMPKTMLGGAGFGKRIKKLIDEKKTVAKESEQKTVEEETVVAEAEETIDEKALLEKELANLEAGLCVDGTKPNKFGCCTGEVFKDLGNTVFACCPQSGDGECFPPIK